MDTLINTIAYVPTDMTELQNTVAIITMVAGVLFIGTLCVLAFLNSVRD